MGQWPAYAPSEKESMNAVKWMLGCCLMLLCAMRWPPSPGEEEPERHLSPRGRHPQPHQAL